MPGLLEGAIKGVAGATKEYAGALISDQLQSRREERLANIRRAEMEEKRGYEQEEKAAEIEAKKKIQPVEGMPGTYQTGLGDIITPSRNKGTAEPAAVQTARTLAKEMDIPFKEAWDISQRTKSDPRKVAVELFSERRANEYIADEETEEQSWNFVNKAMKAAGFDMPEEKRTYQTKEEIRDAFRAGQLSREEAKKLISGM